MSYRSDQAKARRLELLRERAARRMAGDWQDDAPGGDEFNVPGHPYAADLNLFGEGSLFQLLCTVRTAVGQRGLARYLLSTPETGEIVARQEAVQELRDQVKLRESVALLGEFESSQLKWQTFEEWLGLPDPLVSQPLRITLFVSAVLVVVLLLIGALQVLPWILLGRVIFVVLMFQSFAALLFRERLNRLLGWLHPVAIEVQTLRDGLQMIQQTDFHCAKLRDLATQVRESDQAVRQLSRILMMLDERNKDWFYAPSLLVMAGTQLYLAIEQWRAKHGEQLRVWLEAWAEFEALNALANYAHENQDNPFPEIVVGSTEFVAEQLGHPLLPSAGCVRNDVRLNSKTRFYIVSGSNMSGKSTLLRAIGINAVLAYCGAPVRAGTLRLSRLTICASLSVVDSLGSGKSKFMAEVDRLRYGIETALKKEPVLFLVDEIFSGTNSRDRLIAAESVVRTFIDNGAIGLVSTHDLALTDIAGPELRGVNVHTGSKDGSDPMDFDYLLKPGITNETNAIAIARLAGVPIGSPLRA